MRKSVSNKSKLLLTSVALAHALCVANSAAALELTVDLIAKSLGVITQTGSSSYGNATVIDRCHVLTNFHVAFGKAKDPITGKIEIFDDPQVGRRMDFSYDLDSAKGVLLRKTKATVIEFDDYSPGVGQGMVRDKALLRLDECLDDHFVNVTLDRPGAEQRVPQGNLIALGLTKEAGKFRVLMFPSCPSDPATIITGLFLANCGMPRGTSGSMILSSERSDGKLRMVGLTTDAKKFPDGSLATYAIYAKSIVKFIDGVLGYQAAQTTK